MPIEAGKIDDTGSARKPVKKMGKKTLPTGADENPCGKGWYKAADGQCYPRLELDGSRRAPPRSQ